jgi:hypothetical protein
MERCRTCNQIADPDNRNLSLDDQGYLGGLWHCGDLHKFEPSAIIQDAVIVSRHPATIQWLRRILGDVPVLESAKSADVRDKIVFGNVPLHLAAAAKCVWAVEFRKTAPRGAECDIINSRTVQLRCYFVSQGEPTRTENSQVDWAVLPWHVRILRTTRHVRVLHAIRSRIRLASHTRRNK